MARELSKEEWIEWREHDITRIFFQVLLDLREESLQALANGIFAESPGQQNILIGKVNALTKVLETRFGEDGINDN